VSVVVVVFAAIAVSSILVPLGFDPVFIRLLLLLLFLDLAGAQAFPSDLFHDCPIRVVVYILRLLGRLATVKGGLLNLFRLGLRLLPFLLRLKFVKTSPARVQLYLVPQLFRVVRCGGLLRNEISMVQRPGRRRPLRRIKFQELFQQVEGTLRDVVHLRLVPIPQLGPLPVLVTLDGNAAGSQQL